MRYILNGDLTKAVRIIAEGKTESEAIKNAEHGAFTIYEEVNKDMMFVFDGGENNIEPHPSEKTPVMGTPPPPLSQILKDNAKGKRR